MEYEPVSLQKVRAVLKKAGFSATRKYKNRIGWDWWHGYRVTEYKGQVIIHHESPSWDKKEVAERLEQYQAALKAAGIYGHIVYTMLIIAGMKVAGKATEKPKEQMKLL